MYHLVLEVLGWTCLGIMAGTVTGLVLAEIVLDRRNKND